VPCSRSYLDGLTIYLDFHTKNIAFPLPDINSWSVDELYEAFGEPARVLLSVVCREQSNGGITYEGRQPAYLLTPLSTSTL